MAKVYEEESMLGPCRLDRDDLLELGTLVQEILPEAPGFEVKARLGNYQNEWDSMKEFLEHEQLPDEPSELIIHGWHPKWRQSVDEVSSGIWININPLYSSLSVSGSDETWVIGTHSRISRLFTKKLNKVHARTEPVEKVLKSDVSVALIAGLWVFAWYHMNASLKLGYAIVSSVSSAYLILKYVVWARSWRPSRVQVHLKPRTGFSILGMDAKDAIPIGISIFALVVSILQFFIV